MSPPPTIQAPPSTVDYRFKSSPPCPVFEEPVEADFHPVAAANRRKTNRVLGQFVWFMLDCDQELNTRFKRDWGRVLDREIKKHITVNSNLRRTQKVWSLIGEEEVVGLVAMIGSVVMVAKVPSVATSETFGDGSSSSFKPASPMTTLLFFYLLLLKRSGATSSSSSTTLPFPLTVYAISSVVTSLGAVLDL
ncbi:hypothetical protein L1987_07081 [Smallanthus sonchifolius]|uniref:Uncharacterized protein n=1 Tax=Smallanthus sonchifolius TaxID=185202 RepID=A0ACB9K060_9ASTR|nr:hypothetical protein L1987_07081 [Smallanthus sonchifolius]